MKESQDGDDIKINRRSGDRPVFESIFLQQVSDGIDFLKEESRDILKELDKSNLSDLVLEEFGEETLNDISDIVDELSQLKSELIDTEELPEPIKESSKNIKMALNRDGDYIRMAKRRLNRIDSDEFVDVHRANLRVVELCDKAIAVNDSNYEAYYIKGLGLINLERYVQAIEEFINSIAIKDTVEAWVGIADANRLNGDYEDAINVYDNVIEKDDTVFEAFKGKAYAYCACEDYSQAVDAFKKASQLEALDHESQKLFVECLEKIN